MFGGTPRRVYENRKPPPDFARLHEELQRDPHLTLQLAWEEYRQAHPDGYAYSRRHILPTARAVVRLRCESPLIARERCAARLCHALRKMGEKNKLYFGDNLKILREYVEDASVDLIYLDPPFNSSATYNDFVAPLYERRLLKG